MTKKIIKAKDANKVSSEELAEFILDTMRNGNDELGVNDSFSFLDWLEEYLSDIAYGD